MLPGRSFHVIFSFRDSRDEIEETTNVVTLLDVGRWWTNSRPPSQVCFADGGPRFHVIETPGNTATSPTLSDSCAPRRNVAALNAKLVPPEKEERKEGRKENCGRINRSLLLGNFPSDFRNDLGL